MRGLIAARGGGVERKWTRRGVQRIASARQTGEKLFVREMDQVFNAFAGVEQVDELIAAMGDFIGKNWD